jgi:anti-sigma B factor antagonist
MSDPSPRLEIHPTDDGWIVEGEIDSLTAPSLSSALSVLPDAREVVVDVAGVGFMDSSGLRVLLMAGQEATRAGQALVVAHPQSAVRRVIEVSGLKSHLRIRD